MKMPKEKNLAKENISTKKKEEMSEDVEMSDGEEMSDEEEMSEEKSNNKAHFIILMIINCICLSANIAFSIMILLSYFGKKFFLSFVGSESEDHEFVVSYEWFLFSALVLSFLTLISNISSFITICSKKRVLLTCNRLFDILLFLANIVGILVSKFFLLPTAYTDLSHFLHKVVLNLNLNKNYDAYCKIMKSFSKAYECCGSRFFNGTIDISDQTVADECCYAKIDVTSSINVGCIDKAFQETNTDAIYFLIPIGTMILMLSIKFFYFICLSKPLKESDSEIQEKEEVPKTKEKEESKKKMKKEDEKSRTKSKNNKIKPSNDIELKEQINQQPVYQFYIGQNNGQN